MIHRFLARWKGGYLRLCGHRSHRLHLPCWRLHTWDGFCGRHTDTYWTDCPTSPKESNA